MARWVTIGEALAENRDFWDALALFNWLLVWNERRPCQQALRKWGNDIKCVLITILQVSLQCSFSSLVDLFSCCTWQKVSWKHLHTVESIIHRATSWKKSQFSIQEQYHDFEPKLPEMNTPWGWQRWSSCLLNLKKMETRLPIALQVYMVWPYGVTPYKTGLRQLFDVWSNIEGLC